MNAPSNSAKIFAQGAFSTTKGEISANHCPFQIIFRMYIL